MATSNILLFCFLLLLGSHLSASLPTGPGPHPGNLLRSTSGPEPPSNDPFYTPDGSSWTTLKPGTILKQRSITVPSFANATATAPGLANVEHAYQLLYSSTDVFGRPDYMVTTVLVPANANIQHHLSYQVSLLK